MNFAVCLGIGTFIGLICYAIYEAREWYNGKLSFGAIAVSIAGGIAGMLAGVLIMMITTAVSCGIAETVPTVETRTDLIALNDNFNGEGHYYLFSGYTNEELTYNYLYNVEGKGITAGSVEADNCYVNYISPDEKPYMIERKFDFTNSVLKFFTIADFINYEYSLYIPNGSITAENQYRIDLE